MIYASRFQNQIWWLRYVTDLSICCLKSGGHKKWPPPPEQLVSLQRLQEYQVHSPSPLPSHRTQSKVI